MNKNPEDIDSIQKSDFVVINGRLLQVIEVTYSKPGKIGRPKVYVIGIDISTGRRYEDVCPTKDVIKVPNVSKKAYLLVDIDKDGYVTLLNEDTCNTRSDIKLHKDSDIAQPKISVDIQKEHCLHVTPHIILMDGNDIWHPRRAGVASHF
ncbi:unnamed protein product [Rotaria sp. Silwood1]|nr:unnamed protein product [Rotaria sp. Silwood1]CAF1675357.1 unnamed protein product [Rotaria sp. Silwood1]CAF4777492.1 unnamed protein product [Rotaria sp. Silwood1]